MDVSVLDVIKQMTYVIPSIIAATCAITAAIKGVFDITNEKVNHLISWVVSVIGAEAFVLFQGLTFGLGGWDYLVAGVCGIIVGASSNGIYDWEAIKKFFDAISNLFPSPKRKAALVEQADEAVQENA